MNKEVEIKMYQHCNDNSRNIVLEHQRDYDLLIERHTKLFNDYEKLEKENRLYEKDIEKLGNSIRRMTKEHLLEINKLEEENKKLKGRVKELENEYVIHQYRIDKAIDILKGEENESRQSN